MAQMTETLALPTVEVLGESTIGTDGLTDVQREKHAQTFRSRVVRPLSGTEEESLGRWLLKKRAA